MIAANSVFDSFWTNGERFQSQL